MTAEIGKSIQKLRALSPRFNSAAEDAGKIVKLVEEFLTDECRAGVVTDVRVWSKDQADYHSDRDEFEGMYLGYRRVGGKYRITIQNNEKSWNDDLERDVVTPVITPWTDASRGDKLESFSKLPDLLEQIAMEMERGIKSAADTSAVVQSVVESLADSGVPQAPITGGSQRGALSHFDMVEIAKAVNGTTEQQLKECGDALMNLARENDRADKVRRHPNAK